MMIRRHTRAIVAALFITILISLLPASARAEGYTESTYLEWGQTYTKTISSTGDSYRYDFELEESSRITVNLKLTNLSEALTSPVIKIYNDGDEEIAESEIFASATNSESFVLTKGSYYIVVDGYLGHSGNVPGVHQVNFSKSKLPQTSISKLTNKKSRQLTIKLKKNNKVDGYEIQYSTKAKFKKNKNIIVMKGNKSVTKTLKKLSKKKYYVRVRTYSFSVDGVKCYSEWSKVKSKKVK